MLKIIHSLHDEKGACAHERRQQQQQQQQQQHFFSPMRCSRVFPASRHRYISKELLSKIRFISPVSSYLPCRPEFAPVLPPGPRAWKRDPDRKTRVALPAWPPVAVRGHGSRRAARR